MFMCKQGYKGLLIKPQPFFIVCCHRGLFVILDSTISQDTDNSEKAIAGKYFFERNSSVNSSSFVFVDE